MAEQIDRAAMIDTAVEYWVGVMTEKREQIISRHDALRELYLANESRITDVSAIDGKVFPTTWDADNARDQLINDNWLEVMSESPQFRHHRCHYKTAKVPTEEIIQGLNNNGFTEANIAKFGEAMRAELEEESKKPHGNMHILIENNYAYVDLPSLLDKAGISRGYCPERNHYEWKLNFAKGTIIETTNHAHSKQLYPEVRRQGVNNSAEKSEVASRF